MESIQRLYIVLSQFVDPRTRVHNRPTPSVNHQPSAESVCLEIISDFILADICGRPASATSTYNPKKWCSDYLFQTDWSTQWTTTSMVNTYVTYVIEHHLVTTTDYEYDISL